MATDKEKYIAAKAYIKHGDIEAARRLLKQIDHPSAKALLEKPPNPPINWPLWTFVAVLIIGIVLFTIVAINHQQARQDAIATIEAITSD